MHHFENQTFERFYDRDSAKLFSNLEFRRCFFSNSAISITLDPKLRSAIRNVTLVDCEQQSCSLRNCVVEDVLVDGLRTNGLLQIWGAVFQHVTLKGKIGRVMISPLVAPGRATAEQQRAFEAANDDYYSRIDWALDISRAEFEECDLRGLPAKCIRRDTETQIVVTRANAMKGEWRKLDLTGTYWKASLEGLLREGDADAILVAPKQSKKFKTMLRGLQLLREAGVAESD